MNIEEAKEYIHRHPDRVLEKAKHIGYICPQCGNGQGSSGTGITVDPNDPDKSHFKCFKCGAYGDAIELYGGSDDFMTNLKRACERASITLETEQNHNKTEQYTHNKHNTHNTHNTHKEEKGAKMDEPITDYTDFYSECLQHIGEVDYLEKRGFTDPTYLIPYRVGYCESWKNPKAPNAPASERIIIPTSDTSYVARAIDGANPIRYAKVGKVHLFNADKVEYTEPVFIVEGEIDALSILYAGGQAIGLGSVSNYTLLVEYIEKNGIKGSFIIALDNDEAGQKGAKQVKQALDSVGVESIIFNPYGDKKDANEALMAGRDILSKGIDKAKAKLKEQQEAEKNEYLKMSAYYYVDDFIEKTDSRIDTPYTPTGFSQLDTVLDGGLYEGLYIIGAISSLGKTTFTLQVADQIAKSGTDVLVFSLEQSRFELMAKSFSRLTAVVALNDKLNIRLAKSTRDITVYERLNRCTDEELEVLMEARQKYRTEISKHIFILEGVGDISVRDIREAVQRHIQITGNKPVVIIDYLQIIAPVKENNHYTDKQITDLSVSELKRISRDYKLPIIGISSFNREAYTTTVCMEAFKESGSIEYSSDVLIGLQLKGIDDLDTKGKDPKKTARQAIEQAKAQTPREVELKVLKNRNGATGGKVEYKYYPQYNYFTEDV